MKIGHWLVKRLASGHLKEIEAEAYDKHKNIIGKRILQLRLRLNEIRKEKEAFLKLRQNQKFCELWIKEKDVEHDINLLNELL
jgi:hypothetical protein